MFWRPGSTDGPSGEISLKLDADRSVPSCMSYFSLRSTNKPLPKPIFPLMLFPVRCPRSPLDILFDMQSRRAKVSSETGSHGAMAAAASLSVSAVRRLLMILTVAFLLSASSLLAHDAICLSALAPVSVSTSPQWGQTGSEQAARILSAISWISASSASRATLLSKSTRSGVLATGYTCDLRDRTGAHILV